MKPIAKMALAALVVLAAVPVGIWNHELFLLINGANSTAADRVIGLLAGFGDGLVVALICCGLMLWHLRAGIAGLLAFILSGLVAQMLKRMFDVPRPPAVFDQVHVLGAAFQSHSFPSGHATSAGAVFLLLFLLWGAKDWRAWFGATIFTVAAYGRIYGGVHFPFDVWVGFAIGMGCAWLCWRWVMGWPERAWEHSAWSWRLPGMIVLIEAAVLGLGYRMQPATAQPLAFVMAVAALVALAKVWKARFRP